MKSVLAIILVTSFVNMACAQNEPVGDAQVAAQANPGQFVSVGNHHAHGGVSIERRSDGAYLVLQEDFQTQSGPDLRFVLRDSSGANDMYVVAPLTSFQGAQEYRLNLTPGQLDNFDQVVVYCAKFHVDFGVAVLK